MTEARAESVPPEPLAGEDASGERRLAQRFFALSRGHSAFWFQAAGLKIPLHDLSCEGFSCALPVPPELGAVFSFTLTRANVPDRICGQAEVRNYLRDSQQLGCRFVSFADDGAERLRDWLVAHVLMNASVPISEREAEQIVTGRSLI